MGKAEEKAEAEAEEKAKEMLNSLFFFATTLAMPIQIQTVMHDLEMQ